MEVRKIEDVEIVAVIGMSERGIYFKLSKEGEPYSSVFLGSDGEVSLSGATLSGLLSREGRTPVYKGEKIEIQF